LEWCRPVITCRCFWRRFQKRHGYYVKAMLGVEKSGAVTCTTGYSAFKEIAD
jgi:hypothetical protein